MQRDAQPLAHLAFILEPGVAQDRYLAGSRFQQAFQNFDCGGLPCSVGAEQAEAFAGLDLEVEPAHGLEFAIVGLAQIAAMDGYGH